VDRPEGVADSRHAVLRLEVGSNHGPLRGYSDQCLLSGVAADVSARPENRAEGPEEGSSHSAICGKVGRRTN
jgi:hypothetical protein